MNNATKCVELVPGVKFCVTKTENAVTVELDFFGHTVFRGTLTEDHPCIDAHVHILFASATFKACYDFGKNEATFTGKICVVGKCADVDIVIHLPSE